MVAIKFLGTQLAANEEVRERFRHEARITAKLSSRNAVQVFDFGVTGGGEPYLVMELLRGEPLSRRIERLGRLDPTTTVIFLRAAARALSKAHASGIVHRDFKPDNVFLTEIDGAVEVKVVDFGIAKLIGSLENTKPAALDLSSLTDKRHLTRTGRMVGTPHYMGPEQVRMDADIGPAADIWALGIVAYECLTGRCPFDGNSVLDLFTNIQLYNFVPATKVVGTLPASFDDWFRKVCALVPGDRFTDANLAVDALAVALHLDLPREMDRNSDGSRLRADSLPDGLIPLAAYATPTRENLLEAGAGAKGTLLNASASVPVRQKKTGRVPWMVVALSCVAVAGIAFSRMHGFWQHPADHGNAEHGPPVAISRPHGEIPVVSGSDHVEPLNDGEHTVHADNVVRPEEPHGATGADAGTVAVVSSSTGSGSRPRSGSSHAGGAATGSSALPVPTPAAPSATPASTPNAPAPAPKPTSPAGSPFSNPALGI